MRAPSLSIIIPIALMSGRLDNLKETLTSIGSDTQVIIVHDYQDIDTSREVRQLISELQSKKIELIEEYCGSPGKARNTGLHIARGNWVAFADSDDIAYIPKYEEIIRMNKNADVIVGNYEKINYIENEKIIGFSFSADKDSNLKRITHEPGIWRFIFKRSVIATHKFPENLMGEDQIFLTRLDLLSLEIAWHNTIVYSYFTSVQGQLTQRPNKGSEIRSSLRLLKSENITKGRSLIEFPSLIYARMLLSLIHLPRISREISRIKKDHFTLIQRLRWNWYVSKGLIYHLFISIRIRAANE